MGLLIHPFSMTAGMKFSLKGSLGAQHVYPDILSAMDLFPAISRGNRRHDRVSARRVFV